MTDIEQKALALVNDARINPSYPYSRLSEVSSKLAINALCRAIEQHEAFRQEVSDKIEAARDAWPRSWSPLADALDRLIIIAKPDPLAECLLELELSKDDKEARHDAEWLVKTIEKRGGKIVWGEG